MTRIPHYWVPHPNDPGQGVPVPALSSLLDTGKENTVNTMFYKCVLLINGLDFTLFTHSKAKKNFSFVSLWAQIFSLILTP